jgi:hypothetical protein
MIRQVTEQPGTTLFHVAAKYLGDASQWSRLALINDIQDPYLSEATTLNLPAILIGKGQGSVAQS